MQFEALLRMKPIVDRKRRKCSKKATKKQKPYEEISVTTIDPPRPQFMVLTPFSGMDMYSPRRDFYSILHMLLEEQLGQPRPYRF